MALKIKWDDMEKARQFANSGGLKKAMKRAGVADEPDIYFLEKVEKPSV